MIRIGLFALWLLAFAGITSELACVAGDPGDDCCQVTQCPMCTQGAICDVQMPAVAVVATVSAVIPSAIAQPDSPDLGRLNPPPRA